MPYSRLMALRKSPAPSYHGGDDTSAHIACWRLPTQDAIRPSEGQGTGPCLPRQGSCATALFNGQRDGHVSGSARSNVCERRGSHNRDMIHGIEVAFALDMERGRAIYYIWCLAMLTLGTEAYRSLPRLTVPVTVGGSTKREARAKTARRPLSGDGGNPDATGEPVFLCARRQRNYRQGWAFRKITILKPLKRAWMSIEGISLPHLS